MLFLSAEHRPRSLTVSSNSLLRILVDSRQPTGNIQSSINNLWMGSHTTYEKPVAFCRLWNINGDIAIFRWDDSFLVATRLLARMIGFVFLISFLSITVMYGNCQLLSERIVIFFLSKEGASSSQIVVRFYFFRVLNYHASFKDLVTKGMS